MYVNSKQLSTNNRIPPYKYRTRDYTFIRKLILPYHQRKHQATVTELGISYLLYNNPSFFFFGRDRSFALERVMRLTSNSQMFPSQ